MTTTTLADDIAACALAGIDLDEIERVLIEPTALSEEEKAALWLLAWCHTNQDRPPGPIGGPPAR